MPSLQTDLARPSLGSPDLAPGGPLTDWRAVPSMSDDECLALLAKAIEAHDPDSLETVAWLIGRLAVPVE